jgi:predicted small secreted protein
MKFVSTLTSTCFVLLALASCANTIKGVGRDAANTVNATQNAGKRVGNAAAN